MRFLATYPLEIDIFFAFVIHFYNVHNNVGARSFKSTTRTGQRLYRCLPFHYLLLYVI